jgi:protein SCO1/2
VSDIDLRRTGFLVYFGYTHCLDACPAALNNIALAFRELGAARRAAIRPVFITIDPARDTPVVMNNHVASFDAPILAPAGTAAQVDGRSLGVRNGAKSAATGSGKSHT